MKLRYDEDNKIVDVYVEKDPKCPVPFLQPLETVVGEVTMAHEGLDLQDFIDEVNNFFGMNNIPRLIILTSGPI